MNRECLNRFFEGMLSEVIYIYSARFKDVYLRFGKAHRRIVQKMTQKDTIEFLFPQGLEVYGRMGAFPPKKQIALSRLIIHS